MGLSIDVIVPTHNRWELTQQCLACLEAQTVPHSVTVVDNGSTDDTVAELRRLPRVRVVALDRNLGFGAACNRGAAAGTRDVVVLVNNDVFPRPDFLERMIAPLEADERLGSVAGLLLHPGEATIESIGLTADPTLAPFPRLRGRPPADAVSSTPVLVGPCGGAGAYRREAWNEVGGLDEGTLGYGEDIDLAFRLRTAGWGTAVAPDAAAVHVGSASFGRRSGRQRYHGGFARGYLLRRYGVLRTRRSVRTLATEALVIVGDALLSRDLSAGRGRVAGWRSARGLARLPLPPAHALDESITFWESIRLRRVVYAT